MRKIHIVLALAVLPALAAPAFAQSAVEQQRWDEAQQRFRAETERYERERDAYMAALERARDRGRYETEYDAAGDYREDARYGERRLDTDDQVYRGSDGRLYCKRGDGTTGLVIGGATGGILGNVIDGGRHRGAGTLIGGALGALMGRAVEQNSDVRCR
jgi:uncharacterized protein YcfJ